MDRRKQIYEKLKNDSALTALLADGADSVYTNLSPDAGTYPVVVFKIVDDIPSLHADDKELVAEIRFQISIVTQDAEYDAIEERVREDMEDIGAMRSITTELQDATRHYRIMQFIIDNPITVKE